MLNRLWLGRAFYALPKLSKSNKVDGNSERAIRLVGSINILRKFCSLRIHHQ
ncbi:hypothetical protein mEp044_76 [Escherichia phage mEp044]